MKKILLAVVVMFLVGGCSALAPITNPTQVVDVAATSASILQTSVAQTLTAQPTFTSVPPTETSVFATPQSPATDTQIPSSPTLVTGGTPVTATFEVATSTIVPVTVPAGSATLTPTLGILTYGTLPPLVPFSRVTLINRSRTQAYISLQVVTEQGGPTIIEYPVEGQVEIEAPIGHYLYVAWVGGRKMVGEFRLHNNDDLTIILYRDRIEVK